MEQNKVKVPDEKKLPTVQSLCDQADPYADFEKSDADFIQAMKEITEWHMERSDFYRDLARSQEFKTEELRTLEDCLKIPHLWAHFFGLFSCWRVWRFLRRED